MLATLSSCAAILNGSKSEVSFDSDPRGAKVYDNGNLLGKTPISGELTKKKEHSIEFRLDGYDTKTQIISSSLGAGWLILDILLTGIIGIAIDAATQSWNGLDQDRVKVVLEKN